MISVRFAAAAFTLLSAGGGHAADCSKAITQTEMTMCAAEAAKTADAALNRHYGVVMARLSADGQKALRDAQRAWLRFRDKQCLFESNGDDGGSIGRMTAVMCVQRLTEARAETLAMFKTCEEGDVSCPR